MAYLSKKILNLQPELSRLPIVKLYLVFV